MNFKKIALAAAAAAAASPAMAADLPVVAEPVNYVQACDAYGAGYFQLPGQDTCIRVHGRIRTQWTSHNLTRALGDVTTEAEDALVTVAPPDDDLQDDLLTSGALGLDYGDNQQTVNNWYNTGGAWQSMGTTTQHDEIMEVLNDELEVLEADPVANATEIEALENVIAAVGSTRELSPAVEEVTNDYTALARGYVYLESMTATELMTIKTYTELTASWDETSTGTAGVGSAYIQLGFDNVNVLVGRTGSTYSAFGGYSNIGTIGVAEGGEDSIQISATASMGNGFTAAFGIHDAEINGGVANRANFESALSVTQGMFSATLSGAAHAYSDSDYGYAVAGQLSASVMDNVSVGFGASYARNALSYIGGAQLSGFTDGGTDATGYTLAGGLEVAMSEKLKAALDASFTKMEQGTADYDYTVINGSLTYNPVAGMDVVLDGGWSEDSSNNENAQVTARLQYTF